MTADQRYQHRRDLVVRTMNIAEMVDDLASEVAGEDLDEAKQCLDRIHDMLEDEVGYELARMPGYYAWGSAAAEAARMSEWIANQLRELHALRDDVQTVIDALDPPKPKRKYTRRAVSPEQRELDVALRASTVAPRKRERRAILDGEHEVAHVTSGGKQG